MKYLIGSQVLLHQLLLLLFSLLQISNSCGSHENKTSCLSFHVGIKLANEKFSLDMFDKNSTLFLRRAKAVEIQILDVFNRSGENSSVTVSSFRPDNGGVVVYFTLLTSAFLGNSSAVEDLLGNVVTGVVNTTLVLDTDFLVVTRYNDNDTLPCDAVLRISNETLSESTSLLRRRSYNFSVDFNSTECHTAINNGSWSIYKVDDNDQLGTFPVYNGTAVCNWTLLAFTLDYGRHCAVYHAEQNTFLEMVIYGLFSVNETFLIGSLVGFKNLPLRSYFYYGTNITTTVSIVDPDSSTGRTTGVVVYLLCAKYGEQYASPIDDPYLVSTTPNGTNYGGCFQTGVGLILYNTSTVTFTSKYLTINVVYKLELYLVKVGRTTVHKSYSFFVYKDTSPVTSSVTSTTEPTSRGTEPITANYTSSTTPPVTTTPSISQGNNVTTTPSISQGNNVTTTPSISQGNKPEVIIKCVENCARYVVTSSRLAFTADCNYCGNITNFNWQITVKTNNTHINASTQWQNVKYDRATFIIPENHLQPGATYELSVTAVMMSSDIRNISFDTRNVSSNVAFNTSFPPYGGTCEATPRIGEALKTLFTFQCRSWQTQYLPLSYTFYYKTTQNIKVVIGEGTNGIATTTLPSGVVVSMSGNNASSSEEVVNIYGLNITVIISDIFGAVTFQTLSLEVRPSNWSSPIADAILDFIIDDDSELSAHVSEGDVGMATRLSLNLLETLGSSTESDVTKSDKAKITDVIIEKISKLPVNGLEDSLQVSAVVAAASTNSEVLSLRSKKILVAVLGNLTDILKNATIANTRDITVLRNIRDNGRSLTLGLGNVFGASSNNGSQEDKELVQNTVKLLNEVSEVLYHTMIVGDTYSTRTPYLRQTLVKETPDAYKGSRIVDDIGQFSLPRFGDMFTNYSNTDVINAQVLSTRFNPYFWDSTSILVNSYATSLSFRDEKGVNIDIKNLENTIGISLEHDGNSSQEIWSHGFLRPSRHNHTIRYHKFTIKYNDTAVLVKIRVKDEKHLNFTVIVGYGIKPTLENYIFKTSLKYPTMYNVTSVQDTYHIWLPCDVIGVYNIGIFVMSSDLAKARRRRSVDCVTSDGQIKPSCLQVKSPMTSPPVTKEIQPVYDVMKDISYSLLVETRRCMYWSSEEEIWTSQGCKVKAILERSRLHCECDHLTWFAGGILVQPTPLEYDTVLVNFTEITETNNFFVLVLLIVLICGYIIMVALLRRMDRADLKSQSHWSNVESLSQPGKVNDWLEKHKVGITSSFSDHHLWLSVVSKPLGSSFTRVQRATCCFSLLFASMLINAVFYQVETGTEDSLHLGPLSFSQRQFVIGVQSGLMTSCFGVLIVAMFRVNTTHASLKGVVRLVHFVAWSMCLLVIGGSVVFTLFYSMQWGAEISKKWLSSIFVAFCQDVLLIQPGKTVLIALLGSFFIGRNLFCWRRSRNCRDLEFPKQSKKAKFKFQMNKILRDCGLFLVTIILLMIITYGRRDQNPYHFMKSTKTCLQSGNKVYNTKQLWPWMQSKLVKCLFTDNWYNNLTNTNKDYIGNQVSFRCGMPSLRQLRVTSGSCQFSSSAIKHFYNQSCYPPYSHGNEDTTMFYQPHWRLPYTSNHTLSSPWQYTTLDSRSYQAITNTYPGGGYTAVLGHRMEVARQQLRNLQHDSWIDRRTRAVFIEFTLFNPNTALFLTGKHIFENPATGGLIQMTSLTPVAIYSPTSSTSYNFHMVCQLFFYVMLLYYLVSVLYGFCKQRSLGNLWLWLDLMIVCTALLNITFHFMKDSHIAEIVTRVKANPYYPGSFDHVVFWTNLTENFLAILIFFCTVKLMKLFTFVPHIRVLSTTLYMGMFENIQFYLMLAFLLVSFGHFASVLDSNTKFFTGFIDIILNQILMSLGGVSTVLTTTDVPVLFRIYWFIYQFLVSIIILSLFTTILNSAHRNSQRAILRHKEYLEFSKYVTKKISRFFKKLWRPEKIYPMEQSRLKKAFAKRRKDLAQESQIRSQFSDTSELCRSAVKKLAKVEAILERAKPQNDSMDDILIMIALELNFKTKQAF